MYIKSIVMENFKCFKNTEIEFEKNFNLIIGGNNAGKTTIFEALRLWQFAFTKFLKKRTNKGGSSFYSHQYCSFTLKDLGFLRINNFENLFYNGKKDEKIIINLKIEENKIIVELPIIFTLTSEGLNLRFELCNEKKEKDKASELLLKIANKPKGSSFEYLLLLTYITPLFLLPQQEEFHTKGVILNRLHKAKSEEVIRNIIHLYAPKSKRTKSTQEKKTELTNIEKTLTQIISKEKEPILKFYSKFDPEKDEFLEIRAQNNDDKDFEIAQLGSGTLNLLNILSILAYGDFARYKLNVLLLDEPDSHLHAKYQKNLFHFLSKESKNSDKQIFVITHNHELIESADKVLYLPSKKNVSKISSIKIDAYNKVYEDIAPEYHKKMLRLVKQKEIEQELKNLKKITLFCEGSTDKKIIETAYKKLYNKNDFFNNKIELKNANGAGNLKEKLIHGEIPEKIIGLFDCDREGINCLNSLCKKNDFKSWTVEEIKYNQKTFAFCLPIPKFRKDVADWFLENTTIEYMFSDESLKKINVELEKKKGNLYQSIKNLEGNKGNIAKSIDKLEQKDFSAFLEVFRLISTITKIDIPQSTK